MGLRNRSGESVYVARAIYPDGSPYLSEAGQQLQAAGAIGTFDGSRNVYGESGRTSSCPAPQRWA